MTITTMTSREFNQDASGTKKAASKGPCSSLTGGVRRMSCSQSRSTSASPVAI